MLVFITDVIARAEDGAGPELHRDFYWDMNDGTRAFTKRFTRNSREPPTMVQAGDYASCIT